MPGVSVVVKGTTTGTTTDFDGKYSLVVSNEAETLVFSFVGFQNKEVSIGSSDVVNVSMVKESKDIEGVVVTALGISREKKALGYSVQDVDGDELSKAPTPNFVSSLSGKVSGVKISSSNNMGGSSRILLRGANSINGENQPLMVIDGVVIDNSNFTSIDQARGGGGYDYGNMAQDINPEDIKSVSVLKGASAAALYGSRASNGVIVITTKSGADRAKKGKKGIGVSFSTGITWEQVSRIPEFQNKYGGGSKPTFDSVVIGGQQFAVAEFAVDESWGPEMNGQEVLQYDAIYDYEYSGDPNDLKTRPWDANPDNLRNYFETGVSYRTHVALTGGNQKSRFRLSYTNLNTSGVFPNSEMQKNTINFNGSTQLTDKLKASANINYVRNEAQGRPGTGYSSESITQKFYQWGQRQWDMDIMENYESPDGTHRTWNRSSAFNPNPKYSDNPYWTQYKNYETDHRDRYFGNVKLNYEFTDWLRAEASYNLDSYTDRRDERRAIGSQDVPFYYEAVREVMERNMTFLLKINKDITENIGLMATFGGNSMHREYFRNAAETQGGLSVPDFYSLANSVDPPLADDDYFRQKSINSIYGSASFDWKSMVYLDMTLRNDWSSTLPEDNNSYMYPSVTGSFVFTELSAFENMDWFTFGKIRAGWAQVGSDTDPYRLGITYYPYTNFGSSPRYSVPSTLNNADLRPEITTSNEIGIDLRFFDNRLSLDYTYYNATTKDQIFPVDISNASGYGAQVINAGEMKNTGHELMLMGTPIRNDDFRWDITVNWGMNENQVVKLTDDVENFRLANAPFSVSVNATEGEPYGTIIGYDYETTDDGKKIVNSNGMYEWTDELVPIGNVMPDWTGGINNSFTYKGVNLSFLIDMQRGGQFFSTSNMWGMYSGMFKETVADNIRTDGIVLDGVMEDPNNPGEYIENDQTLSAQMYGLNHYYLDAMNVFDADFFKLREVKIGYTLPNKLTSKYGINNFTISFIGRELLIWGTETDNFDPEHNVSANNIQGIEGAQNPPTRNYGFQISFNI